MSINVTISGNLIGNIPRSRKILSDVAQIQKSERQRRKRLRLEQVRQQSKERSNRILEHAKLIEQEELERLRNDKDSELKLLHDERLRNIQQKYQDEMENIGQAHILAAQQPNADEILQANRERNRIVALERGKEAARRLKENNKKKDKDRSAAQKRIQKTRESENVRAAMISQLPKVPCGSRNDGPNSQLSENDENVDITVPKSSRNAKLITSSHIHRTRDDAGVDIGTPKQNTGETTKRSSDPSKHVVVGVSDVPCTVVICESDDQKPRRTVPMINLSISKADKIASYNPEDYQQTTSEDRSSISSFTSQDSLQCFTNEERAKRKPQKQPATFRSSQVQMYNLNTQKENQYKRPSKVVERIDCRDEPNAEDRAKEITRTESFLTQSSEMRREAIENRSKDAELREKVRNDHKELLQTLDLLRQEERKLKASQVQNSPAHNLHMHPKRKKESRKKQQRKMERNLESTLRSANLPPTERIITLTPRPSRPITEPLLPVTKRPLSGQSSSTNSEPLFTGPTRNDDILEMLEQVDRIRLRLLQEYKESLPENILNYLKSWYEQRQQEQLSSRIVNVAQPKVPESKKVLEKFMTPEKTKSPEIRVINISAEKEIEAKRKAAKSARKERPKFSQLSDTAVQTSLTLQQENTENKSVQVEMSREKEQISLEANRMEVSEKRPYPLEPTIKIIAQTENVNSNSDESSAPGIVINMKDQQVKVTPKKPKRKTRSDRSTKKTFLAKPHVLSLSKFKASPVRKLSKQSRIEMDIPEKTSTQTSSSTSTEISQVYSFSETGPKEGVPYTIQTRKSKNIIKIRQTSDTSTSYASPPNPRAGTHLPLLNSSTPILEILDSSRSGAEKIKRTTNISPVSSPETPSPRTMRLPSNKPRSRGNIGKPLFKRSKQSYPTTTSSPNGMAENQTNAAPSMSLKQQQECHCNNPSCQLYHGKSISQLHRFMSNNSEDNLKNIYEIQKSQQETVEKIASLSKRLKKLQNAPDLSLLFPMGNDSSYKQIVDGIFKDMNNISETKRMNLIDTQNLFNNDKLTELDQRSISSTATVPPVVVRGDNNLLDLQFKPIILHDSRVQIRQNGGAAIGNGDELVVKLLKEILEKSKNVEKSLTFDNEDNTDKQIQNLNGALSSKSYLMTNKRPISVLNNDYCNPETPMRRELSTIKEMDTPDTGAQIHSIVSSSPLKNSRAAPLDEAMIEKPIKSSLKNKSTQVQKPYDNSDYSPASEQQDDTSISSVPSKELLKKISSDHTSDSFNSNSQNSMEKRISRIIPWGGTTIKKTRQNAALDSTSSDEVPKSNIRHTKRHMESTRHEFSGLTDVSSISFKDTIQSTELSVLQKARTSTPNLQRSSSSGT